MRHEQRAELTVLERSEHVAEWVRLAENKGAGCADIPRSRGQPQGGINAATRALGTDRSEAQRAVKIAGLSDEAKKAAVEAGLSDNQAALLNAAKLEKEKQADAVRRYEPSRSKAAPAIKNPFESGEDWRKSLFTVWNRGGARHYAAGTSGRPAR